MQLVGAGVPGIVAAVQRRGGVAKPAVLQLPAVNHHRVLRDSEHKEALAGVRPPENIVPGRHPLLRPHRAPAAALLQVRLPPVQPRRLIQP